VPWASHCAPVADRPGATPFKSVPSAEAPLNRQASPEAPRPSETPRALAEPPAYFAELTQRAQALAEKPPAQPPKVELPPAIKSLTYDAYRKIRFRPERSLWRGEPGRFEVQFFHAGFGYKQGLLVSLIERGKEQRLPFTTDWFSYEGLAAPPPAQGLEFTGLRLHTPLNTDKYRDEVVVFHGASYFRPLGKGNVYGLSARGLAIDMGEPTPEEFPAFTHLYLVRPGAEDAFMWVLGLLESRRTTGAYAFRIEPGDPTRIEVTARLFPREPLAALGLAPLTSMYLFGEDEPNRFGDFRPEVHDSDALLLWSASGERLVRPLRNPKKTTTSSFRLDSPRGFGLLQRDQGFDHYQDLEAHYQDRPSVWIETLSGFAEGSVRLLEIQSTSEHDDNIAVAWVPAQPPGKSLEARYRLHVGKHPEPRAYGARVIATRVGRTEQGARFLVDFSGPGLSNEEGTEVVVSCTRARILEQHVEQNPYAESVRASFEVALDAGAENAELRAYLRSKADALTETWSYLWQPNR
jgi:glucans biosynthesis protein